MLCRCVVDVYSLQCLLNERKKCNAVVITMLTIKFIYNEFITALLTFLMGDFSGYYFYKGVRAAFQ